jgi:hypothetical protein
LRGWRGEDRAIILANWFSNRISRIMGGGEETLFWSDEWVGGEPLKRRFERLYSLSMDKGVRVAEVGRKVKDFWIWELRWSRERYVRRNEGGVRER